MPASLSPAASSWREIPRPPPPYRRALVSTARHGPRILVLSTDAHVISRADHGTERASRYEHGRARSSGDIAFLIADACAHWDRILADLPPRPRAGRGFVYRTRPGAFSAPVSADELPDLLAKGELGWADQVWDAALASGGGAWLSIAAALGFPSHDDIILDARD